MGDFFLTGGGASRDYEILRDDDLLLTVRARAWVQSLWERAEPYLEPRFRERARANLHACFWEMYLAATMVDQSRSIVPWRKRRAPVAAPDIQIGDVECWIEASTASAGTGPDRVPDVPVGRFEAQPIDLVKLRITQVLREKLVQWGKHVRRGVVSATEPFVVAVNIREVPWATISSEPWELLGSVFPIGTPTYRVDSLNRDGVRGYLPLVPPPRKASDAQVRTDAFWTHEYSAVSLVIFSRANSDNPRFPLGGDFIVVHNPHASIPLPRGYFPYWREYWIDGTELRHRARREGPG